MNVEFIGLCLMVMTGSGFMAILPDWHDGAWIPGPNLADHYAIIAAPAAEIVSPGSGWKKMGAFIDDETKQPWIYFVIESDTVRFENVVPTTPPSIPDDVPQLGKLCEDMAGVELKYLTAGSGAASHVHVGSGKAEAREVKGRIDTILTLEIEGGKNLVINAGGRKKLEVKGGARIANVPLEQIDKGFPKPTGDHDNHFLAYYKLASNFMGRRCRAGPDGEEVHMKALDIDLAMLGTGCSNSQYP